MHAVTQVNARLGPEKIDAEADPTEKWGRPALQRKSATNALGNSAGVETTAWIEGMHMKHGKPTRTAAKAATGNPRGPGPVASVAERLVVALKPGNVGGAKGPHFGHVVGRDKGIAIGFGLATQKNPSVSEATLRSGEDCTARRDRGLDGEARRRAGCGKSARPVR